MNFLSLPSNNKRISSTIAPEYNWYDYGCHRSNEIVRSLPIYQSGGCSWNVDVLNQVLIIAYRMTHWICREVYCPQKTAVRSRKRMKRPQGHTSDSRVLPTFTPMKKFSQTRSYFRAPSFVFTKFATQMFWGMNESFGWCCFIKCAMQLKLLKLKDSFYLVTAFICSWQI